MSLKYVEKLESVDFDELNQLLSEVNKENNRDVEHTKKAFEKSQKFVFAYDEDKLVGAVRAISDGDWAVIYNHAVKNGYSDEVAKELIKRLVTQLKGQHIFVNARIGSIAFYEENGFQRTKTAYTYVGFEGKENEYPDGYFLPLGFKFENEYVEKKSHTKPDKESKKKDLDLVYTSDRSGIDYERATEVLSGAFGKKRNETVEITKEKVDKTKYLFDLSDYVSFAYDGKKLIGVARAITDGVEEAYIQNVAVDPDYQGLGIGWEIVKNLGEDIQRDGLNPFLHTHPGAVGFYNHEGFLRNKTALDYRNDEELSHPMPAEMETGFYLPKVYRFIDEINM